MFDTFFMSNFYHFQVVIVVHRLYCIAVLAFTIQLSRKYRKCPHTRIPFFHSWFPLILTFSIALVNLLQMVKQY